MEKRKPYLRHQQIRRKTNRRVEEAWDLRVRRSLKIKLIVLLVMLPPLGLFSWWGCTNLFEWFSSSSLFEIKTIDLRGVQWANREELIHLAGLDRSNNLFALDLKGIRASLLSHKWVKGVEITRIFPSTVRLSILEHIPVAIVVLGRKLFFVDHSARIIKQVGVREKKDFFIISGIRDPVAHQDLIKRAIEVGYSSEKLLTSKISEVNVKPEKGLTVYTYPSQASLFSPLSRARVSFSFEGLSKQQARLARVVADLRSKRIMARAVDLRFREKVIVKIDK